MAYYSFLCANFGLFFCLFLKSVSSLKTELQLERFEAIDGKEITRFDLRVRKFNRTTYTLNGTFIFLQDLGESYEMSLSFAYSSLGNNQFNEYPMKVPRKKVCHFTIDEYQRRQYLWINHSNMPRVPKDSTEYCPFPKGAYWIRDMPVDASWIPPVVPSGLWRMTVGFWNQSAVPVFQLIIYGKFSKKIT